MKNVEYTLKIIQLVYKEIISNKLTKFSENDDINLSLYVSRYTNKNGNPDRAIRNKEKTK
jgi:hypothetical protein